MAEHALSTSLSRRTMLTHVAAALAPAVALAPQAMALADPDATLLRRLNRTAQLRAAWHAAREEAERLFMATYRHPDFSRPRGITSAGRAEFEALAARTGYRAAADRAGRLHDLYVSAGTRAFGLPASTLSGAASKLRLAAVIAGDVAEQGVTDLEPDWLNLALGDLGPWIENGQFDGGRYPNGQA
jgi:hypothetical protein